MSTYKTKLEKIFFQGIQPKITRKQIPKIMEACYPLIWKTRIWNVTKIVWIRLVLAVKQWVRNILCASLPASKELPAVLGVSCAVFIYHFTVFSTCIFPCDQISFRVSERKLSRACWVYWGDCVCFF